MPAEELDFICYTHIQVPQLLIVKEENSLINSFDIWRFKIFMTEQEFNILLEIQKQIKHEHII
jgi:hypothetical protein